MKSKDWFISQFPESLFLCKTELLEQYKDRTINGLETMKNSSVFICGLARNIATTIPYTIARIERLASMFKNADIFIYENDSEDATRDLLVDWEFSSTNVDIQDEKLRNEKLKQNKTVSRRVDMAYYRNKYLNEFYNRRKLKHYDYLLILDMDLKGGFSYEGIANSFGWNEIWDCIGANGLLFRKTGEIWEKLFYDSWAFRRLCHRKDHDSSEINLLDYSRGEPPIRVFSVGSGLIIYKSNALDGEYYTAEDCDHPTLNLQLVDKGKTVWLNPSMITLYSPTYYTEWKIDS